jgi:hypothetical protein
MYSDAIESEEASQARGYARGQTPRRPRSVISIRAWMSKRVGHQMPATPCLAAQGWGECSSYPTFITIMGFRQLQPLDLQICPLATPDLRTSRVWGR